MRLLLYFWGSGDGGDASACIELARALTSAGVNPKLVAYAFENPEVFKQKAAEAGLSEPTVIAEPNQAFEAGLNRSDFDLIHVHHGRAVPKRTDIVPLRHVARKSPMVLTAHGPTPLDQITYGGWKSRLSRIVSAKWFKAVIVPTQAKVEEWKKMTPLSGNVVAIPNVVRFFKAKDKCEARKTFGIPRDAKVALFCSRLDSEKRPMAFIKAIEHAAAKDPKTYGVMAGSGSLAKECQDAAKDLPIKLLGYVNDVETLYSIADVFVQPSAYESFCITLLQAVALGLPCVASNIPVFKEMYGDLDSIEWWDSEGEIELGIAIVKQWTTPQSANPTLSTSSLNTQHSSDPLPYPLPSTLYPPDDAEPIEGLSSTLAIQDRFSESSVVKAHLALYTKVLGK